jgi:DNA replication and repair protein RecF
VTVIDKLSLQNFRSYSEKEFNFLSAMTLVVGPNTSGKTNLLEAIYLLASGRSFRAGIEAEMIAYGGELARVSGLIVNKEPVALGKEGSFGRETEEAELEIVLTNGQVGSQKVAKKRYLVNGVGKRRMDFVGHLRVVLFGPGDLEIIIGSPSVRRNYLDNVLEQVDQDYRRASLSYQKGLRQRNKILEQIRERGRPRSVLFFWNKLLIENGEVITQKREEFINFINQRKDYLGGLRVIYDRSVISPQRLEKYTDKEIAAGMTLVGPHRDDFRVVGINSDKEKSRASLDRDLAIFGSRGEPRKSRDLAVYGSRGEQRMAVFSLKLAELEYAAEEANERPILLLDDIFSELDRAHRARVLEIIPKQQTIITTTDLSLVKKKDRQKTKMIRL